MKTHFSYKIMNFSKNNSNFFKLIVIFLVNYVESGLHSTDCSTIVTSNGIRYLGCNERVRTNSLSNRKTLKKTIYSFKVSLN